MEKSVLRKEILNQMKSIDASQRIIYEKKIYQQFTEFLVKNEFTKIGLYWSFFPEVSTHQLINQLVDQDMKVYLPCLTQTKQLEFAPYTSSEEMVIVKGLVKQPRTIERIEIPSLDIIVVPGVVFQKNGHRIGYGGGYYDRLLAQYPDIPTVSFIFPEQLVVEKAWEIEEHDQEVKLILNPSEKG